MHPNHSTLQTHNSGVATEARSARRRAREGEREGGDHQCGRGEDDELTKGSRGGEEGIFSRGGEAGEGRGCGFGREVRVWGLGGWLCGDGVVDVSRQPTAREAGRAAPARVGGPLRSADALRPAGPLPGAHGI